MTAGLKRKREEKMSAKKNELYIKIMREHGIDPKAQTSANKLKYEIPPLPFNKSKPKTPVTQIFRDTATELEQGLADTQHGKRTV